MKLIDFTGYKKLSELNDPELLKDIQYRLGVAVDGIYGPDTLSAFKEFKRKAHLSEPEMLGPSTAQALIRSNSIIISKRQAEGIFKRAITQDQLNDLNLCLKKFDITTPARIRHFMAQIAHESGGLRWLKELATGDAYQGRRDLGNIYPGDGRRYKGAGAIQLTGRHNYTKFGEYMQDPNIVRLGANYVAQKYPFTSAGFWWMRAGMNQLIDKGATVKQVTRRVNGGYNGLADRVAYFTRAENYIA